MHPEIRKFWETTSEIVGPTLIGSYEIYVPVGGPLPIFRIETIAHGNKYRFDGKWYSEEEMLRLVKMKAFL